MKTIIEKHKPLNTEKNIIALFEELKKEQYTYSTELGLKILREIGSVNLEYLQILKETLQDSPQKKETTHIPPKKIDSSSSKLQITTPNISPKKHADNHERNVKENNTTPQKKRLRKSETERLIIKELVESLTCRQIPLKEYKREYQKALKKAAHYNVIEKFKTELKLKQATTGWTPTESIQPKKEVGNNLSDPFKLDWKDINFQNGKYTFFPHKRPKGLKPLTVKDYMSLECYNYIRNYFEQKLPEISWKYNKKTKEIFIIDEVKLKKAILMIVQEHKQAKIEKRDIIKDDKKGGLTISFTTAWSKALTMSPSSFKKYKSKFIDYLVSKQLEEYRIVPLNESFDYKDACTYTETAFLFSLDMPNNYAMIVLENVNPNRSTLLFYAKKSMYMDVLKAIHSFMQGTTYNKRSELRSKGLSFEGYGITGYSSINHEEFSDWTIQLQAKASVYRYL